MRRRHLEGATGPANVFWVSTFRSRINQFDFTSIQNCRVIINVSLLYVSCYIYRFRNGSTGASETEAANRVNPPESNRLSTGYAQVMHKCQGIRPFRDKIQENSTGNARVALAESNRLCTGYAQVMHKCKRDPDIAGQHPGKQHRKCSKN